MKTSRRRIWLRGLSVAGTLVLVGIATVSGTAQEGGGSKSSLFQIPNIFRSASREVETPPAPPEGRFLRRARQLIADAKQLESAGHVAAALDMARRADSVWSTASHTIGVQWPTGQRTPADYVGHLEQRVLASAPQQQPKPRRPSAQQPLPNTRPLQSAGRPSSTTQANSPVKAAPHAKDLLLDWGNRNRATASANDRQGPPEHSKPVERPIQLIGAGNQSTDVSPNNDGQSGDANISGLLNQLRSLDTWEVFGKPGVSGPSRARGESSPAKSPEARTGTPSVGGWQPDINDQNVGPIPTHVPHTPFDNGASELTGPMLQDPPERLTVETPAVPTPAEQTGASTDPFASADGHNTNIASDAEPTGPQPVRAAHTDTSHTSVADRQNVTGQTGDSNQGPGHVVAPLQQRAEANLLMTAAVQVLATFIGVLLAILAFRAVAIRIWGSGMGIFVPVAHSDSVHHESGDLDGADTVPFAGREDTGAEGETELPDPASVPFRLVGSSYEDERLTEEQAEREREEAILKSVFDQNINLIDELQGIKKSA